MIKLSREDIKNVIPHREPFLFVDEITECIPGEYAKGVKRVSEDEYYFKGHFPLNPVMPGVIILETLAQAGAVSILMMQEHKGKIVMFAGIEKARFKRVVRPGEILSLEVKLDKFKMNIGKAHACAKVGTETACTAEFLFTVV